MVTKIKSARLLTPCLVCDFQTEQVAGGFYRPSLFWPDLDFALSTNYAARHAVRRRRRPKAFCRHLDVFHGFYSREVECYESSR
jgi:hypothetical protein